jgi:hypothetical protein
LSRRNDHKPEDVDLSREFANETSLTANPKSEI